jgi:hypothetical protein
MEGFAGSSLSIDNYVTSVQTTKRTMASDCLEPTKRNKEERVFIIEEEEEEK